MIFENHVPFSSFFGAPKLRYVTKFIVIHNIGVAGQTANQAQRYFADPTKTTYSGVHYCVDIDGMVHEFANRDHITYHCGYKTYTPYMLANYPSHTTNQPRETPNWISCGIEMCHPLADGKPTPETLMSTISLAKELMAYYNTREVLRHYDITGKNCPAYYVAHSDEWERFKEEL